MHLPVEKGAAEVEQFFPHLAVGKNAAVCSMAKHSRLQTMLGGYFANSYYFIIANL